MWLALAVALLAALMAADFVLSASVVLIGYYGLTPLMAGVGTTPAATTAIGAVATAAAVAAGRWDEGSLYRGDVVVRVGLVVACSAVAVAVAVLRSRREQRLRDIAAVAEATQHAILGGPRLILPDVDVAVSYHSARPDARVGGDFYEAVNGRYGTRVIIGDVRGKGLPAVELANTVVGAFRHAALRDADLAEMVNGLDATVSAFAGDEDFVTALVVQIGADHIDMICCGHPPPLIGAPGGLEPFRAPASLPLGLSDRRQPCRCPWRPNEIFIAYTDGLMEARDSAGRMLSFCDIANVVRGSDPGDAVRQIAHLGLRHAQGRLDDDMAVLAFTRRRPAGPIR